MRGRHLVGAALGIALGTLGLAAPAAATPTAEVVQGAYLRLVSVADWEQAVAMQPEETMRWDVAISAEAPDPGTITIGLSAEGGTSLVVDAMLCDVEWTRSDCPTRATSLRSDWNVPRDGELVTLGEVDADSAAHLRLRVGAAAGTSADATRLLVHAIGAGESIAVDSTGTLPSTGLSPAAPWLTIGGVALLACGAVVLAARAHGGDRRGRS